MRTDLSPLGDSLTSPRVPHYSFSFYCVPSSSTMTHTVVLILTAAVLVLYAYSMQYKVSCRVQVLPWKLLSLWTCFMTLSSPSPALSSQRTLCLFMSTSLWSDHIGHIFVNGYLLHNNLDLPLYFFKNIVSLCEHLPQRRLIVSLNLSQDLLYVISRIHS